MKYKVLLTGAQGQLGQMLLGGCPAHWAVTGLGSQQLDITDSAEVRRQIQQLRPNLIINAAAYNAVDQAEHEREQAFAVNAQGPLNLAQAANEISARLVHVSTDYVFDGSAAPIPYTEQDSTNPLNAYGESKLQGEQWVLNEQPHALVVRTAWVYSAIGQNFVATMLRAAQRGKPLRVVSDQIGAPTHAGDLAQALISLAEHPQAAGGIYHYCGATALTRYDFVRAIFQQADHIRAAPGRYLELLNPIASSDYPSMATRPKYSVLDCQKTIALGIKPRPLMENLPQTVSDLLLLAR